MISFPLALFDDVLKPRQHIYVIQCQELKLRQTAAELLVPEGANGIALTSSLSTDSNGLLTTHVLQRLVEGRAI